MVEVLEKVTLDVIREESESSGRVIGHQVRTIEAAQSHDLKRRNLPRLDSSTRLFQRHAREHRLTLASHSFAHQAVGAFGLVSSFLGRTSTL